MLVQHLLFIIAVNKGTPLLTIYMHITYPKIINLTLLKLLVK